MILCFCVLMEEPGLLLLLCTVNHRGSEHLHSTAQQCKPEPPPPSLLVCLSIIFLSPPSSHSLSSLSGQRRQSRSPLHASGWEHGAPQRPIHPLPPPLLPAAVGHIMNISAALTPLKICILIGPKCRSSALSSLPHFFLPLSSLTDTFHTLGMFSECCLLICFFLTLNFAEPPHI